jgi:hypothetical protein
MKDKLTLRLEEAWKIMETTSSMPPGFENLVGDLNELPSEEEFNGVGIAEAALDDAPVSDIDLKDIIKTKTDNPNIKQGIEFNRKFPAKAYKKDKEIKNPETGKPYQAAERPQRLIHSSSILKVLTPDGTEIDQDKLKQLITVRPKQIVAQNSKLASSGKTTNEIFYDLTLPAYQGLFYNEREGKFQVVKTCPSAGACKAFCYAARGSYIQYEGPWLSQARMINYLMNDYIGFKEQLSRELKQAEILANKKGKKIVLRWHDSGDWISPTYLLMAFDVARETPTIRHYAYTKQVDLMNKYIDKKPENFIVNYSKGGTQDKSVDFSKEKHSKVIPYALFKDLKVEKGVPMTPEDITAIKDRLVKVYSLDPGKLLTYDELQQTPVGASGGGFNVIVRPGDGDDAASRKDVIGTLLLIH